MTTRLYYINKILCVPQVHYFKKKPIKLLKKQTKNNNEELRSLVWAANFFQSHLFSFHDVNRNVSPRLKGRGLSDLSEYECANIVSDVPVK